MIGPEIKGPVPCRTCGSEAVECIDSGSWCQVVCAACGAFGEAVRYSADYAAKEKAIEVWNQGQSFEG